MFIFIIFIFIFIFFNKWSASTHPPPGPARRNHNLLEPMLVWPFGLVDLFLLLCVFLQGPCSFHWAHSTNFDPLKQEAIFVIISLLLFTNGPQATGLDFKDNYSKVTLQLCHE